MKASPSSASPQTKVCAKASASGPATFACAAGDSLCSASKPPEWGSPAVSFSPIAEVSRTERIAVPIEAPDWRTMFIAVLVRAIAAAGTACIAAVIVGIIESPIPSPSTKPKPQSRTYGVWLVTKANGASPTASSGIPQAAQRSGP
jgi:hypothetical protein